MTADKDGWIKHDGGPCPVAPGRLAMINDDETVALPVFSINWAVVKKYRAFARVNPPAPGPSDFVRDTAALIMAAGNPPVGTTDNDLSYYAAHSVLAALALEKALKEVSE